jgi:TPR repeat protein
MTRKTFDRIAQVRKRDAMWLEASYLEDRPDRPSLRKAYRLVRSAVKLGLRDAQGSLAHAYDRVDSVRPSRRMSVHWYRKAWRSGSCGAARNLGVTMQQEGRITTAMLWFRRAIASGDPDARYDLAKILLKKPNHLQEAIQLLEDHVAAGPQVIYAARPVGESPRVNMNVQIEDEDYNEAKQLLQKLKGLASV